MALKVEPGDVLLTRSGGFAAFMIRLGAAFRNRPSLSNHVAIVHHADANGTVWVLEGRPSGVGWRSATDYLASAWTMNNRAQPKTAQQRAAVCETAMALIGTPYSWSAIAEDAGQAFGLTDIWARKDKKGKVPGELVCSSLAAYAYSKAGLEHPAGGDRNVTPGDWCSFLIEHRWAGS